jgi:RecB family endonuclease NucS
VFVIEIKTGMAKSSQVDQLSTYKKAIQHIFEKPVHGYLYYVGSKEFIAV